MMGKQKDDASNAVACGASASLSISNNSTEPPTGNTNKLLGGHRRTADNLAWEIKQLGKAYGVERLGFLTLTFGDHVTDIREAQRRFNSLNSHVLKSRYERAIVVLERSKNRRIHFHLVVVLGSDIRSGADFAAFKARDYRSANAALRAEWAFWRKRAPEYRFGRTELLPVRTTEEGLARYVGKYVSKHIGAREEGDKGARVVRYIGFGPGDRKGSSRFGWATPNGWLWRLHLRWFAESVGAQTMDDLKAQFGPRWAFLLQSAILASEPPSKVVKVAVKPSGASQSKVSDSSGVRVYFLMPWTKSAIGSRKVSDASVQVSAFCAVEPRPEFVPSSIARCSSDPETQSPF